MKLLITGGAGFIGTAVCRYLVCERGEDIAIVDKLTYAANLSSLATLSGSDKFQLFKTDICDKPALDDILQNFQPDVIMHLAAESHVDRSIDCPADFINTNIVGTYQLLESALEYYSGLDQEKAGRFRFHHISTDEVFGDLPLDRGVFTEKSRYAPSSPYSASKAASDHLAMAWYHTYGLPVVLSNCSNNYGPNQFPEKLIPLIIINAIEGKKLPIYGNGANIRDWLHVDDHARALHLVATRGEIGQSYNIGGNAEYSNLQVVTIICKLLDTIRPIGNNRRYEEQIEFVVDRPGHDLRYAIDPSKIKNELGWEPLRNFTEGIESTIMWYLENEDWWQPIRNERYKGERLGSQTG